MTRRHSRKTHRHAFALITAIVSISTLWVARSTEARPEPALEKPALEKPALEKPALEKKVKLSPDKIPKTARDAIEAAFPGATIRSAEQEVEGEDPGQIDVVIGDGDAEYELEISASGKILEAKDTATDREIPVPRPKARAQEDAGADRKWTTSFATEGCRFTSSGRNRFWVLEPGYQLTLEGGDERLVITVLDETQTVGGVETRIVEEREWEDGALIEVSRNFVALCATHGDVFYFGEEVDMYKNGEVVSHDGAWRADEPDSAAGILMPGTVLLGARYYQEIAPGAMDRAEHLADDVTLKTPCGTYEGCLQVEETSALKQSERDIKVYAPGIGLIQDEELLLTAVKPAGKQR